MQSVDQSVNRNLIIVSFDWDFLCFYLKPRQFSRQKVERIKYYKFFRSMRFLCMQKLIQ